MTVKQLTGQRLGRDRLSWSALASVQAVGYRTSWEISVGVEDRIDDWVRWLVFVAALLVGLAVFAISQHGRDAWKFVLDSRIELYKVFWPTRQETGMTTLVVFGFVLIMGLFFWGIDAVLALITRSLLGTSGSGGTGMGG